MKDMSAERKANIMQYLDNGGRIVQLPKRQNARRTVLQYLSEQFTPDHIYSEREVNDICNRWHTFDDYFLLRRELIDHGFLRRKKDGSEYWKTSDDRQIEEIPHKS